MWTIEWIEPDNTRSISNGHNEKQSVIEAYHYGTDKVPSKKRKREDEDLAPAKKGITPTADEKDASKEARSQVDTSKGDNIEPKPDAALGIPHSEIGVPATSTEVFNPQLGTSQSETPAIEGNDQLAGADPNPERPSRAEKYERQFQRIPEVPATDQGEQGDQSAGVDVLQQPYHFFLHKPRTSSTRPVLIPITPSSSLRDILRGRTVLEFPTIYVFTSPSPPSESFILEAAYLEQERQEQQELEDALKSVRPGAFPGTHDDGTGQQGDSGADEFDSKRILDVLKQDLGAGL